MGIETQVEVCQNNQTQEQIEEFLVKTGIKFTGIKRLEYKEVSNRTGKGLVIQAEYRDFKEISLDRVASIDESYRDDDLYALHFGHWGKDFMMFGVGKNKKSERPPYNRIMISFCDGVQRDSSFEPGESRGRYSGFKAESLA